MNYLCILFISSSNYVRGSNAASLKARQPKRNTKGSLLLPASPTKKNGSFFETTEPVGPTIVPVKDQPSTYTSDDITAQDNRSAIFILYQSITSIILFPSRRIYLRDLPAHVADMSNDSGYKFSEEYEVRM